ncbi:MAG: ECF transporter S component [Clostridia bacterium]|nr:ECF transporter S component [Clostridia bacterium]
MSNQMDTKKLVLAALLTALVVILQLMGAFIRFGTFQISLVLIPIVIGAAECGASIGAWLGFVFGVVVLANGDAAPFLAVNAVGTVITVLLKGTLCGYIAGVVFYALSKINRYLAVVAAAIVCPVVNTGVFLLGCLVFFMDTIELWAGGGDVWKYMIFALVGGNFLFEIGSNIILSPAVVRLLNIRQNN